MKHPILWRTPMAIPNGMKIEDYMRRSTGLYKEIRLSESKENPSAASSQGASSAPSFSGILSTVQKKQPEPAKTSVQAMTLEDYQVKANRIPAFQKIDRLRMNRNKAAASTSAGEIGVDSGTPARARTASPSSFSRKMRSAQQPAAGRNAEAPNRTAPVSPDVRQAKIHRTIEQTARKYGLAPELVHSIVQAESNYQPNAVSSAGAMGLMQLMPETAKEMGVSNPFDIQQNIEGGIKYLKKMLDTFDGDLKKALQAYNAGPGAVVRHKGEVPYSETRSYVQRVMASVKHRLG